MDSRFRGNDGTTDLPPSLRRSQSEMVLVVFGVIMAGSELGFGSLVAAALVGVVGVEEVVFVEAGSSELLYGMVAALAVKDEFGDHAANDG